MITPLFADLSGLEIGGIICAMLFSGVGCIVGVVALFKKQDSVISPQPLAVQIVDELHNRFADKKSFEKHVSENTQRHAQLFNRIDGVEEHAGREISGISKQVTALQTETRLQSTQLQKLDNMEREIRDMPGKIVVDILNAQKLGRINDRS